MNRFGYLNYTGKNQIGMKQIVTYLFFTSFIIHAALAQKGTTHKFEVGNKTFLLDQKPFIVKAAEIHYPRIPEPYW